MGDSMKWKNKIATLLWRMFDLQYGGTQGTKFRWMQGFADGYIQAYIDLGIANEKDVLALIQGERKRFLESYSMQPEFGKKAA
jgi:hypothetical protein